MSQLTPEQVADKVDELSFLPGDSHVYRRREHALYLAVLQSIAQAPVMVSAAELRALAAEAIVSQEFNLGRLVDDRSPG